MAHMVFLYFFCFNDTATTEIYTLSLHDALPIWSGLDDRDRAFVTELVYGTTRMGRACDWLIERFLYRDEIGRAHGLNSSHANISYAVFCLKKKKKNYNHITIEHE